MLGKKKKCQYRTESGCFTFYGHDGLWVWLKSYDLKELYKRLFLGNEGGLWEDRKNREVIMLTRKEKKDREQVWDFPGFFSP